MKKVYLSIPSIVYGSGLALALQEIARAITLQGHLIPIRQTHRSNQHSFLRGSPRYYHRAHDQL